ncbi:MAG: sigma-54 factor interaction domain-containing protein [Deltaproteobacteria bacterium]|nr:sigma-54 factor interaction domain-containing protein [Deltaproteobacteria bacterium]
MFSCVELSYFGQDRSKNFVNFLKLPAITLTFLASKVQSHSSGDVEELRIRVDHALEKVQMAQELERLKEEVGRKYGVDNVVGKSKQIIDVFKAVSMVAAKKSPVLITGESGTGKELIARAIHYNSDRRAKPFIVVNCAALPDTLIESELFGYEKGAFTNASQRKAGRFELANTGTLFLDEIGELNLGTQAKFLRAIEQETFTRLGGTEEIKVDVRLIAASNRDLETMAMNKEFRLDLFYRLNGRRPLSAAAARTARGYCVAVRPFLATQGPGTQHGTADSVARGGRLFYRLSLAGQHSRA